MVIDVRHGDMLEVLPTLAADSIDSCVTDPPYHLTSIVKRFGKEGSAEAKDRDGLYKRASAGFMGKQWDGGDIAFRPETWAEVYRVLKPGAHLLAFGGSRGYHRMFVAIEDAGFEIRDCVSWLYGSGFPKSHNAGNGWGTALKPAWEPICVARKPLIGTVAANVLQHGTGALNIDGCRVQGDGAKKWEKPRGGIWRSDSDAQAALVDNPLGRWPANVIHDGSEEVLAAFPETPGQMAAVRPDSGSGQKTNGILGKFATNSDHEPRGDSGSAARFFYRVRSDEECNLAPATSAENNSSQSSEAVVTALKAAAARSTPPRGLRFIDFLAHSMIATESELRTACEAATTVIQIIVQRFLLALPPQNITLTQGHAKVAAILGPTGTMTITLSLSKSDGFADLATFSITPKSLEAGASDFVPRRLFYTSKADKADRLQSKHPTVKPVDLMAYLCRLVTPPGGTVLDPFAGSGSTGMACMREGFNAILIEREAEYVADINRRLQHVDGADTPLFAGEPEQASLI